MSEGWRLVALGASRRAVRDVVVALAGAAIRFKKVQKSAGLLGSATWFKTVHKRGCVSSARAHACGVVGVFLVLEGLVAGGAVRLSTEVTWLVGHTVHMGSAGVQSRT